MQRSRVIRLVAAVALILCVPLVAMQFTDEVNWTAFDFAAAGALLLGTGLAYEFAASRARSRTGRIAVGAGLMVALLLIWAHLAVGVF